MTRVEGLMELVKVVGPTGALLLCGAWWLGKVLIPRLQDEAKDAREDCLVAIRELAAKFENAVGKLTDSRERDRTEILSAISELRRDHGKSP